MHIGHYISGAGHIGLLGWLVFGHVFAAESLPFEARDVSIISSEEFAALTAKPATPEPATEVAQPEPPVAETPTPEVAAVPEPPAETPPPDLQENAPAEETPELAALPPEPPQAEVSDAAPVLSEPPAEVDVPVPDVAETPVPTPSDRVAPENVAPPQPDAQPDPVEQAAVAPDAQAEKQQEAAEAQAPEAAATQIVTEAEKPARVMTSSPRPPARRPNPPVRTAERDVEKPIPEKPASKPPTPKPEAPNDAVNAALTEALAAPDPKPAAPSGSKGPPLSAGEKEALRVAVSSCWNTGSLSTEALRTVVVVSVSMDREAKPILSSIRLKSSSGGTDASARQAFEAAKRAIIRCTKGGYDLPQAKFDQWQDIEITFNPERMRNK